MDVLKVYESMLEMLRSNIDIQDIINKITEELNNPLMIVDSNFRILMASTKLCPADSESWKESIKKKYVSETIILSMQETGVIEHLQEGKDHAIRSALPDGHTSIRVPLYCNERYRGFLGLYDYNQEFGTHDSEILSIAGKIVSIYMMHNSFFDAVKSSVYDLYLYELLETKSIGEGKEVCERYKGISLGNEKILVVFDTHGNRKAKVSRQHLINQLDMLLLCQHSVVFEKQVVTVISMKTGDKSKEGTVFTLIDRFCHENDITAGISMMYRDTEQTYEYYKQAIFAASIGKYSDNEERRYYFYQDYITEYIAENCLAKHPVNHYINEAITKIKKYDEQYHTPYLETLEIYLDCFGNLRETAVVLGIHYNSIKYRINNLQEIAEVNLKDAKVKYDLWLSLQIVKYYEKHRDNLAPVDV